jgi:serine/threonine protein kinase
MSTFTSEPGTRLGGRYRLEDRVAAAGGWAAWKAIDETLARAVTVLTFAPAFPRLREVVTAARAASRLNDSRFAQVFDVEDDWDHAYIVTEWAAGETLDDLVAEGPIEAERGARIVAEAAQAMSAAHAAGLAHLCLVPSSVRWTPGGGVKITGLGINAALSGASAENPAEADTQRLGMLLYAALTGFWPGPDCPTLPPAPVADGILCTPRQVRAGVPAALDEITSHALQLDDSADSRALTTPAELSAALLDAIPPEVLPPQAPSRPRIDSRRQSRRPEPEPGYWPPDRMDDQEYLPPDGPPMRGRYSEPYQGRGGPSRTRGILITLLSAAVLAGVIVLALHLTGGHKPGSPTASNSHPAGQHAATGVSVLTPASAEGLAEPSTNASAVIAGNPSTPWQTQFYIGSPLFGGEKKPGSGLLLNMGRSVRLNSVTVTFGPVPGADVQIRIGTPASGPPPPNNTTPALSATDQAFASAMTTVAQDSNNVANTVTFPVNSSASGQYVLIWFTKLPPMQGTPNQYQAEISSIVVKGSS